MFPLGSLPPRVNIRLSGLSGRPVASLALGGLTEVVSANQPREAPFLPHIPPSPVDIYLH